jgi:hypothetical protein
MRYDLQIRGKIKSLPPEEQEALEREAREYEECKDAIASLKIQGLDPTNPNPNLLREALYLRHYDSKAKTANFTTKNTKAHKENV